MIEIEEVERHFDLQDLLLADVRCDPWFGVEFLSRHVL